MILEGSDIILLPPPPVTQKTHKTVTIKALEASVPHIPVLLTERKAGPGQTVTFYPAEAVMWTGLGLEQSTKLVTSICVESPDGKS